jgi:hypothetical protein
MIMHEFESSNWTSGSVPDLSSSEKLQLPETKNSFLEMSNKEMVAYLRQYFPEVTEIIWGQLAVLDTPSGVTEQTKKESLSLTHLGYELGMIRTVLEFQEEIEQHFFAENDSPIDFGSFQIEKRDCIRRLVYMILLSDVGKAGGKALSPGESSPIAQIYIYLRMEPGKHGEWLKGREPSSFPDECRPALESILQDKELSFQVFAAGNFRLAPFRIAMHCASEVALQDPKQGNAYADLFKVDSETEEALEEIGMNVDTTLMKDFLTQAHLLSAEQLFATDAVPNELKDIALLGLFHHYSQGVHLPHTEHIDITKDSRGVEVIALLEILDKLDANCHRSNQTSPEALSTFTEHMVMPTIKIGKEDDHPEILAYTRMFEFLKQDKVLQAVLCSCSP